MNTTLSTTPRKNTAWIGGAVLILFGALALVSNYYSLPGHLLLYAPGAIFLAWGLVTRHIGPCIPGSILSGLATTAYLITGPLSGERDIRVAAIFTLSLASSFFLISLLSLYTDRGRLAWWPLIPGSILAASGGLMFGGETGLQVLNLIGKVWPAALVLAGLYVIFKRQSE